MPGEKVTLKNSRFPEAYQNAVAEVTSPAADAGPRQCEHKAKFGERCLDCGARYYKDEWHSSGKVPDDAPVPQEAAPRECDCEKCASRLAPTLDWAMRVALEIVPSVHENYAFDDTLPEREAVYAHVAALVRQAGSDEITRLKQELADLRAQRYESMEDFRFRGKTAAELTELIARGQAGSERERELLRRIVAELEERGFMCCQDEHAEDCPMAEASRLLGGESK